MAALGKVRVPVPAYVEIDVMLMPLAVGEDAPTDTRPKQSSGRIVVETPDGVELLSYTFGNPR